MDYSDFRTSAAPLPTPRIPDADDGGLGYDEILRDPERNVLALVGPWDGFEDGDTVAILVNNRIFGQAPASAADKDTTVDVLIPARNFAPLADGSYEAFARVTNQLGIPVTSPAPVALYLKLSLPGGPDPVADTPYRNENLAPPAVDPAIIDPDTSAARVTIAPWQNKAAGDRLILRWGLAGNEQEVTVAAGEESQPYTFTVERAMIDAGGFGSGINVNYQVYDQVQNWSLWSPPTLVAADDPGALDPPWVDPTVGDAGEVIDLTQLGSADARAEVFNLVRDDVVTVHLDGLTAEGTASHHDTPPQTALATGRPLIFTLPNALFAPLAQGTCAIGYTIKRGQDTLASAPRRLSVTGQLQRLEAPYVAEAIGDVLDPGSVPNGAHAMVKANPLIVPGSRVSLEMYGTTTGGTPVGHEDGRDIGASTPFPLPFVVPANKIAALSGSQATFAYAVDTFDAELGRRVRRSLRPNALYPSPATTYRIAGATQNLPPPSVPQAEGDRLDPARIDDFVGAQVDVRWTTMAANDRVTLTWTGTTSPQVYTDTLTVRDTTRGVSFFVPKTPYVTANDGGEVTVQYTVAFASGGSDRSEGRVLQMGAEAELEVPTLDRVIDDRGNEVLEGSTVVTATVDLQGTAEKGRDVAIYDGSGSSAVLKGTATADPVSGTWDLLGIAVAAGGHRFYAKSLYHADDVYSNVWLFTVAALVSGYEDFENATPVVFQLNAPVALASGLTIEILAMGIPQNPSRIAQTAQVAFGRGALACGNHSILEFRFNGNFTEVEFDVDFIHGGGHTVTYVDAKNSPIEMVRLPYSGSFNPTRVSFSAPIGQLIAGFRIHAVFEPVGDNGFLMDHIRWSS
ncbi:hypothetical protein [Luteibacter sp.]|jgi:hypothetical protein|uniref:hypothetical protein n=1 Tax=Luteibacter sp. TaxID=1886636 RepID=UPI002F41AF63